MSDNSKQETVIVGKSLIGTFDILGAKALYGASDDADVLAYLMKSKKQK